MNFSLCHSFSLRLPSRRRRAMVDVPTLSNPADPVIVIDELPPEPTALCDLMASDSCTLLLTDTTARVKLVRGGNGFLSTQEARSLREADLNGEVVGVSLSRQQVLAEAVKLTLRGQRVLSLVAAGNPATFYRLHSYPLRGSRGVIGAVISVEPWVKGVNTLHVLDGGHASSGSGSAAPGP